MKDWSKADWVDPALNWKPKEVPQFPDRVLIDIMTKCNLRCKMCPIWGVDSSQADAVKGVMSDDNFNRIIEELAGSETRIEPYLYGDPLLFPNIVEKIKFVKDRGMPVIINTNGLAMSKKMARDLVECETDTICFSIDAATPEILKKVRGIDKLAKIEASINSLLDARGGVRAPRIGVSFVKQASNQHEEEIFIDRWKNVVDFVRIALIFENGTHPELIEPKIRIPCPELYSSLVIHNNGDVPICCIDALRENKLGNVFTRGVDGVWHGEEYAKTRYYHETGQWDKVPMCKSCNGWSWLSYEEEIIDGMLIRRSPQITYYNSLEKLENWTKNLRY
jgi:radical SAM protein with 4Fe4S-binding SPASM domain